MNYSNIQFTYLGSIKADIGDCSQDIGTRITMAKKRAQDLKSVWKNRRIQKSVKLSIIKTLVRSILF